MKLKLMGRDVKSAETSKGFLLVKSWVNMGSNWPNPQFVPFRENQNCTPLCLTKS